MGNGGAPGGAAPHVRPRGVAWVSLSLGGVLAVLLLVMSGSLVTGSFQAGGGSSDSEGGSGVVGDPPGVVPFPPGPGEQPDAPLPEPPPATDPSALAEWLAQEGIGGELARAGLACAGDDPEACEALVQACDAGSLEACDVLWRAAGSRAERELAATCGRRTGGESAGECRSLVAG